MDTLHLIDLSSGLILADIPSAEITLFREVLLNDHEDVPHYYIDAAAYTALLDGLTSRIDAEFKDSLKKRAEALSDEDVTAFIRDILPAQDENPVPIEYFLPLLNQIQEALASIQPAALRTTLLNIALKQDQGDFIQTLNEYQQRDLVEELLNALPMSSLRPVEDIVLYDYNHMLNFGGTIISVDQIVTPVHPTHRVLYIPTLNPDSPEARHRLLLHRLIAIPLRCILESMSAAAKKHSLLQNFESWYEKVLFIHFFEEFRSRNEQALASAQHLRSLERRLEEVTSFDLLCVAGTLEYRLHLEAICGHKLAVGDVRSSDPYCVFTLVDDQISTPQHFRTKPVPHSLHPSWNNTFDFICSSAASIHLQVFDKDLLSPDDPIGQVRFSIAGWNVAEPQSLNLKLEGVERGEIELIATLFDLERDA